jgi:polysaccharide deacetylase family protein (PEP-CTERM system associated)
MPESVQGTGPGDPKPRSMSQHLFTVDVEEHFQVLALEPYVPRECWSSEPSRVARSVDVILGLLAERNATGTFFTLGAVAERTPEVVRRIAEAGHEVASHGWSHRRVPLLKPAEFRTEVARSRDVLAELTGQPVLGYRAPNFSIVEGHEWAFEILAEEGYQYDASVFPGRAGAFARPGVQRLGCAAGALLEFAMTPATIGGMRIPAGGGAWFRLLPYALTARALRQAEAAGSPGVFYIHPWEVDPGQPRVRVNTRTRIRHYGGLARTEARLRRLLQEFSFTSIASWAAQRVPAAVAA